MVSVGLPSWCQPGAFVGASEAFVLLRTIFSFFSFFWIGINPRLASVEVMDFVLYSGRVMIFSEVNPNAIGEEAVVFYAVTAVRKWTAVNIGSAGVLITGSSSFASSPTSIYVVPLHRR